MQRVHEMWSGGEAGCTPRAPLSPSAKERKEEGAWEERDAGQPGYSMLDLSRSPS